MDTVRVTVIGDREVAGVGRGGTVDLDPATVDVAALVAAGHIVLASRPAPPKRKADETGD
ncbi:MAG: hypothetical protein ACRDRZ_03640 [Pseudonocardiaceae bacterium]